ncbi:MAG: preprotein translocase subunit SecE [bacterium]|nr:preprotein translocase subunit SecE [bacterium]
MKPFASLSTYLKGVRTEFKKVQWPSKKRFLRSFWLVILSVSVATLVVAAIDTGLQYIIKTIIT